MLDSTRDGLVDRLSAYDRVVEVGIGHNPALARALAEVGVAVTATDIQPRAVPPTVEFVVDDLTAPDPEVYADAGAVYGLNLPPELHRPAVSLASEVAATLVFTTLGGDPPVVPVDREPLPTEPLFVARR